MILRSYQQEMVDCASRALKVHRRVLLQSPTGSGKTAISAHMMHNCMDAGWAQWFVCHRDELIQQTSKTLIRGGVDHSFIASGYPRNLQHQVQVGMVGTIGRRLDKLAAPKIIFLDECISGDSLVETDAGLIPIRDVPLYGASTIKSAENGVVTWKRILAWRRTGEKEVLRIRFGNGSTLRGTSNHPLLTNRGWVAIGDLRIGDVVLSSPQTNAASSLGRSLGMAQYKSRTQDPLARASLGLTRQNKPTGCSTKPSAFNGWSRSSRSLRTRDTDRNQSGAERPASQRSMKSTISSNLAAERKQSALNGSTVSLRKELHGGIAMMEVTPAERSGPLSIPKDIQSRKTYSSATGWLIATARPTSIDQKNTGMSPSRAHPSCDSSPRLSNSFPYSCDTSWEKVTSITSCEREDVYDLSVEDTHCFFANGLLVHNCHHAVAGTWKKIIDQFPEALIVGLSATPQRLDGRGLDDVFNALVPGPQPRWLMDQGWLSDYRAWTHAPPDLSGLKRRGADFDPDELAAKMSESRIVGDAVEHYLEICPGERGVAFCVNVEHAIRTRDAFVAAGVRAEMLDGATPKDVRRRVLDAFRAGEVDIITSVDLFGEGFDLPEMSVAILMRPTESLSLFLQQCGRPMRPVWAPGYDLETIAGRMAAIANGSKPFSFLLDHAGNIARHGLPDAYREWTLEGRKKRASTSSGPAPKGCPRCFGANPSGTKVCRYCSFAFVLTPREIEIEAGDLVEIQREQARVAVASQTANDARSYDEVVTIMIARGHNDPATAAEAVWNKRNPDKPVTEQQFYDACKRVSHERRYKNGWAEFRVRMRRDRIKALAEKQKNKVEAA